MACLTRFAPRRPLPATFVILLLASAALAGVGRSSTGAVGLCPGGLQPIGEVDGLPLCVHGSDPVPSDDLGDANAAALGVVDVAATAGIQCYGTGTDGPRVQLLYVHAADVTDRYASVVDMIRTTAAGMETIMSASAAETGGERHLRFLTDSSCNLDVVDVALSATGDDNFTNTRNELAGLGYNSASRKYVSFVDANVLCGIGTYYPYSTPATASNPNNTNASWSRLDTGCWNAFTAAHELMHNLGAVAADAPNPSAAGHCTDEYDLMCYADGVGVTMVYNPDCPVAHADRYDCHHDDYFSTNPGVGSWLSTHWNAASSQWLMSTAGTGTTTTTSSTSTTLPPPVVNGGGFHPVAPARLLDTRPGNSTVDGLQNGAGRRVGNADVALPINGRGGVPASGVSAVVLNVTAITPTSSGYLTVYPTGSGRPTASNINFSAGMVVPNLVTVGLGTGGSVQVFNFASAVDVVVDVAGWYDTGAPAVGAFHAVNPARLLDTRPGQSTVDGSGAGGGKLGAAGTATVQVTGRNGIPSTGVAAVVLNVTAVVPTAPGFLTVYPAGGAAPNASNLNFVAGQVIPNLVVVGVGTGGGVTIRNALGLTDVVADVAGWFDDGSLSTGKPFHTLSPARLLDTRPGTSTTDGQGLGVGPVGASGTASVLVVGRAGVPVGATAVVLNVTAVLPSTSSFITAYPSGTVRPNASNLNLVAGTVVANLVTVPIGADGRVNLYNLSGTVNLVADIAGWYGAP